MSVSGKEINQRINKNLLKKVCEGALYLQYDKTKNKHQLTDTFRALSFKPGVTCTLLTTSNVPYTSRNFSHTHPRVRNIFFTLF